MATEQTIIETAASISELAKKMKSLISDTVQALDSNTASNIIWDSSQDQILADAGLNYTGPDISNTIGSLAQYLNYWENLAVQQGDHRTNYEKVTQPVV